MKKFKCNKMYCNNTNIFVVEIDEIAVAIETRCHTHFSDITYQSCPIGPLPSPNTQKYSLGAIYKLVNNVLELFGVSLGLFATDCLFCFVYLTNIPYR